MSKEKKSFDYTGVIIESRHYMVYDFDRERAEKEGPKYLLKGRAYRVITDMTNALLPYRGEIRKGESWSAYDQPGIYIRWSKNEEIWKIHIAYPRGKKQRDEYAIGRERDVYAAVLNNEFVPDQFRDIKVDQTRGDAFMPPLRPEDDPLNKAMKIAIRKKQAPFEFHGKRLEALAVGTKSIEGINIRNNAKRGILNNTAMSASKFILYANTWQLQAAIILRDDPNSKYPMFENGEMYVIFPNSEPFEINDENLIDVKDDVAAAITEGNTTMEEIDDED